MTMPIKSIPVLIGQTVKQSSEWMILDDQYIYFCRFYIYRKGSDDGDNFMGISIKSDARRRYIQRNVVSLPNKWKKYEQKFANIK